MRLSELKNQLRLVSEINFRKADGTKIPSHFHVTEIADVQKKFIDCGGVLRTQQVISIQLWESTDTWHRLEPKKLIEIIDLSIQKLKLGDHEIEVEYQGETIGKYQLAFAEHTFILLPTTTACLATDQCKVPDLEKKKVSLASICAPGSGCC